MTDCPRSIVVAVDFGDASGRAVAAGGAIAERCGATLRLLHAETFEAPAYFTSEQLDALRTGQAESRHSAEQAVLEFGRRHTSYPFVVLVEDRSAVEAILHAAAGADLVVMGTHGRRGPSRWWLGSVAERVLRDTPAPLLIEHANTTVSPAEEFRLVVVHAAAPLAGERTLAYVSAIARRFGGVIDNQRGAPADEVLTRPGTLFAVACPIPRTSGWLAATGEPLVRGYSRPILFVPESVAGETV
jgi:nucleotide-binding universal stress UspA family protein